jgi:serine/threonine-protein kinase SRPK3
MDGIATGPKVPSYSVMPTQLVTPSDEISDPRIMISDIGEAWLSDTETREELQTPVLFLPPETTFAKDLIGKPADVWSLDCTLYEILGERPLFEGFMPDKDDIIAEIVSSLGLLPQQWWESWQARGEFFLEDGSWKTDMERFHDSKSRPLLLRIHEMGRENDIEFCADEAMSLEKMLRAMLT